MKIAPENIFPGARIKLGEEVYYVIKVNAKSFYASKMTYQEFLDCYNKKLKGVTFTTFCKQNDIKSYKYTEPFEIEETEFNRKVVAVENSKNVYALQNFEKLAIVEYIQFLRKKGKKVRLSPIFTVGNKRVFFLEERGNSFLTDIDGDYVMFSLETDEWIKISTVYDFKEKFDHIPWEKLSVFASARMIA